ncbi:MAG: hypothetical protein ACPIOQ_81095, partial [Promethearchaeia archaeon]
SQHDRVTAAVQNATHSALIAFGLSLKKIGYDAELAAKISTPPHRAMISVIQVHAWSRALLLVYVNALIVLVFDVLARLVMAACSRQ